MPPRAPSFLLCSVSVVGSVSVLHHSLFSCPQRKRLVVGSLTGSKDASLVDVHAVLNKHQGHTDPKIKQAWFKLDSWTGELERLNSQIEHMRNMLQQAAMSDKLTDVERVLKECSAHRHKREFAREIFAAAERADYLADRGVQVHTLLTRVLECCATPQHAGTSLDRTQLRSLLLLLVVFTKARLRTASVHFFPVC